jgi:hypothetical protein
MPWDAEEAASRVQRRMRVISAHPTGIWCLAGNDRSFRNFCVEEYFSLIVAFRDSGQG